MSVTPELPPKRERREDPKPDSLTRPCRGPAKVLWDADPDTSWSEVARLVAEDRERAEGGSGPEVCGAVGCRRDGDVEIVEVAGYGDRALCARHRADVGEGEP